MGLPFQNFRLSREFSSGTNQENLYHLHPNRNFREFVVNGKQPMSTSDRILKIHFWELCRVISNDDTSYFARYAWTLFSKLNWSLVSSLKEHRLGKTISFPESALLCPAERATIRSRSLSPAKRIAASGNEIVRKSDNRDFKIQRRDGDKNVA